MPQKSSFAIEKVDKFHPIHKIVVFGGFSFIGLTTLILVTSFLAGITFGLSDPVTVIQDPLFLIGIPWTLIYVGSILLYVTKLKFSKVPLIIQNIIVGAALTYYTIDSYIYMISRPYFDETYDVNDPTFYGPYLLFIGVAVLFYAFAGMSIFSAVKKIPIIRDIEL